MNTEELRKMLLASEDYKLFLSIITRLCDQYNATFTNKKGYYTINYNNEVYELDTLGYNLLYNLTRITNLFKGELV